MAIEREIALRIEFNDASNEQAEASLDQMVSFEVREVDVDDLLNAILEPLRLDFSRDGTSVIITVPNR